MEKTTNLEVVTKDSEIAARNEERLKMIELLNKKIEDSEKNLQNKVYLIEGGSDTAGKVYAFITTTAQWKFSEALGIIEATRQVFEASQKIADGKTKEFLLPQLAVEAIYYFLSKAEGTGLESAEAYVSILKPVSDALSRAKQDRSVIDQLVRDRATLESAVDNGTSIENEDSMLKEIQEELSKEI